MNTPIEAVLLDYGHTLIYFDERPHSALLGAYENVNRLLADTLEREVPAAPRVLRIRPRSGFVPVAFDATARSRAHILRLLREHACLWADVDPGHPA